MGRVLGHNENDLIAFYASMHQLGVKLDDEALDLCVKAGAISDPRKTDILLSKEITKDVIQADTYIQIEDRYVREMLDEFHVSSEETLHENEDYDKHIFVVKKETKRRTEIIKVSDWMVQKDESGFYEDTFYNFICSILDGWQHKKSYNRFEAYKHQASLWYAENTVYDYSLSEEDRLSFLRLEVARMKTNSLYALSKYLQLKDGQIFGGKRRFEAYDAQALVLYLFDCAINQSIAKLRQIGLSSALGPGIMTKTMLTKNCVTKFVSETGTKTSEIYEDKVRVVVDMYPEYVVPSIRRDAIANKPIIVFGLKSKSESIGSNSRFIVENPTPTVINGGSPDYIAIDEAGNIVIIDEIIDQGRPTLFWINPVTKKMEMKRVLTMWGTGKNMEKGGESYRMVYTSIIDAFRDRYYDYGIVPVFLNVYSKPGITDEFLEKEKRIAYSKTGAKAHLARSIYHQTYPITIDDVFMTSSQKLISDSDCVKNRQEAFKSGIVFGKFVPIYDKEQPLTPGSYVPYKIIAADFHPYSQKELVDIIVPEAWIVSPPDFRYKNRYYKGTDPIMTSLGHSRFSSVILDEYEKRIVAGVNLRSGDYKYDFMQSALCNLYYGQKEKVSFIPELIESNIGTAYYEFCMTYFPEMYSSFIETAYLPEYLKIGAGTNVGIRKSQNAMLIVGKIEELLAIYSIPIPEFWAQIKTFVKKITEKGKETWEPISPNHNYDDIIDACVYAYIARLCYPTKIPVNVHSEEYINSKKTKKEKIKKIKGFGFMKSRNNLQDIPEDRIINLLQ